MFHVRNSRKSLDFEDTTKSDETEKGDLKEDRTESKRGGNEDVILSLSQRH
jgi:hypothetical protein